ncbi:XRE family transcriptional regulator [Zoogloea sp.]|uniref:XRE family transcriptional regulator n=1 Tax=Zoogloea sp. TaxID=49181 RepID=UPI001416C078|nr:MAG: ImmA/IrrE family metallo-endopeptidase [Zoogloea sp.]
MESTTFSQSIKKERIILARESRGMSQGELAELLDISNAKLSKVENGIIALSDTMLSRLASALQYPEAFFTDYTEIFPLGLNYYRKNKGLSTKKYRQIEAFVNLRRGEIEKLLHSLEFQFDRKVPHCDIDDDKYGSPSIIASSVRKFWNIPSGPIDNMILLLESAGIIVVPCDFGTRDFSGVSTWTTDGVHLVFINKNMPGDRMRFTLAHELGHMIMHRLTTETMEKEAHIFASEFLMPKEDIIHQLYSINLDRLGELKMHWKVSMASILMRSSALGMISDARYRELWTYMGKYRYKSNEPVQYNIPQEKPTLLSEMITTHLQEWGYSIEELASFLLLNESEFRSIYGLKSSEDPPIRPKLRLLQ